MAKKIYGDLSATGNIQINGSNTIRDVNGFQADSNGNINIPTYTKSYIDKLVSMMPVSRVGSLDYLPLSISGSFEGATTLPDNYILPGMIEGDGTYVYLRPGTNGSASGFYYSYLANCRTTTNLTPVLTNAKYVPSFFTDQHKLISFVNSSADEVLFMKTNNGTDDTYTFALTNGTMNQTAHQYLEIERSLLGTSDPQYVHIYQSLVYVWCIESYASTDAFDISLYAITLSDIKAGTSSTLVRASNWHGNTINGNAITQSNTIRVAAKYTSTVSSDDTFVLQPSNATTGVFNNDTSGVIKAVVNDTNTGIRLALYHQFYVNTSFASDMIRMWGISININPSSKLYTIDQENGPITVTTTNNVISVNNPYDLSMVNINGLPAIQGSVASIAQAKDGFVMSSTARFITSPEHKLSRGYVDSYTTAIDSWNLSTRKMVNTSYLYVKPVYGTPIGENLINPTIVSSTRIMLSCSGTDNGNTYNYEGRVYTDIGTDRSYTYNSVVSGSTINGFAPNSNRHQVANSNYKFNAMVTLISASGTVQSFGSSFIEGVTKTAYGALNTSTMDFSTTYTLSNTNLLTNLKNSAISAVTFTGNVTDSRIVLYYVPDSTYGKSIAVTTLITDNTSGNNSYCIVSEVNVTISGTVISALSTSTNRISSVGSNGLLIDNSYMDRMSGLVIAKYSGFSYIGFSTIFNIKVPTNATFKAFVGKLDSSNAISSLAVFGSAFLSASVAYQAGVLPNVGFGLFEYGTITDYQTKLIFKNHGTTEAQLNALIASPTSAPIERIVVASQDAAQGLILYFGQKVPVLINGNYFELPATSIDLSTIDSSPANKTFYLYVVNIEGSVQYQLSTTLLSEELYRIYIGTIVTGASSITSISTEKVTRFLTYRTSTTERGSAIPASTGVPSGTGTRWK